MNSSDISYIKSTAPRVELEFQNDGDENIYRLVATMSADRGETIYRVRMEQKASKRARKWLGIVDTNDQTHYRRLSSGDRLQLEIDMVLKVAGEEKVQQVIKDLYVSMNPFK